jgi:2-haloalkanoic acid dehalogenase type II
MLDIERFRALSFDCYGTLIDWEAGLSSVLAPWAARHGLGADGEALLAAFGEAESRAERENPRLFYPEILRIVLRAMAERLGASPDAAAENELARSVGEWPPFPDSGEALRALRSRYKLAILSNVDRDSFGRSEQRLGVRFDLVVTAQDVGSYKPDERNFRVLLAKLAEMGIAPDETLHVAQSLYHDHVPAKRLGLATVWIDRRRGRPGPGATAVPDASVTPDLEFPSMREFATRLLTR